MDFSWTDEQLACKEAARHFASEHLNDDLSARDAIGGALYSGTSDIQRNIIASQLGVLR